MSEDLLAEVEYNFKFYDVMMRRHISTVHPNGQQQTLGQERVRQGVVCWLQPQN